MNKRQLCSGRAAVCMDRIKRYAPDFCAAAVRGVSLHEMVKFRKRTRSRSQGYEPAVMTVPRPLLQTGNTQIRLHGSGLFFRRPAGDATYTQNRSNSRQQRASRLSCLCRKAEEAGSRRVSGRTGCCCQNFSHSAHCNFLQYMI